MLDRAVWALFEKPLSSIRKSRPSRGTFTSSLGNPGEGERGSGMIPNGIPGWTRTVIWDESEHQFRDEAEQFQANPGTGFGLSPDNFHRPAGLDNTMARGDCIMGRQVLIPCQFMPFNQELRKAALKWITQVATGALPHSAANVCWAGQGTAALAPHSHPRSRVQPALRSGQVS